MYVCLYCEGWGADVVGARGPGGIFIFSVSGALVGASGTGDLTCSRTVDSMLNMGYGVRGNGEFAESRLGRLFPRLARARVSRVVSHGRGYFRSCLDRARLGGGLFDLLGHLRQRKRRAVLLAGYRSGETVDLYGFCGLAGCFIQHFFCRSYLNGGCALLGSLKCSLRGIILCRGRRASASRTIAGKVGVSGVVGMRF